MNTAKLAELVWKLSESYAAGGLYLRQNPNAPRYGMSFVLEIWEERYCNENKFCVRIQFSIESPAFHYLSSIFRSIAEERISDKPIERFICKLNNDESNDLRTYAVFKKWYVDYPLFKWERKQDKFIPNMPLNYLADVAEQLGGSIISPEDCML